MAHIHTLDPPGRFLKLERNLLHGGIVWSVLSEYKAMQKTYQALRGCNRQDRYGYATTILDVVTIEEKVPKMGVTNK